MQPGTGQPKFAKSSLNINPELVQACFFSRCYDCYLPDTSRRYISHEDPDYRSPHDVRTVGLCAHSIASSHAMVRLKWVRFWTSTRYICSCAPNSEIRLLIMVKKSQTSGGSVLGCLKKSVSRRTVVRLQLQEHLPLRVFFQTLKLDRFSSSYDNDDTEPIASFETEGRRSANWKGY